VEQFGGNQSWVNDKDYENWIAGNGSIGSESLSLTFDERNTFEQTGCGIIAAVNYILFLQENCPELGVGSGIRTDANGRFDWKEYTTFARIFSKNYLAPEFAPAFNIGPFKIDSRVNGVTAYEIINALNNYTHEQVKPRYYFGDIYNHYTIDKNDDMRSFYKRKIEASLKAKRPVILSKGYKIYAHYRTNPDLIPAADDYIYDSGHYVTITDIRLKKFIAKKQYDSYMETFSTDEKGNKIPSVSYWDKKRLGTPQLIDYILTISTWGIKYYCSLNEFILSMNFEDQNCGIIL
jgi:hypothetical protein